MKTTPILITLLFAWPGCGGGGSPCEVDTTYNPTIDPADFVDGVDNPLFPLVPGTTWVYMNPSGERIETTVTAERKMILGISCVQVHDQSIVDGEVVEDTLDWYAQDTAGNVWYMGEDTKELEGGQVTSTLGSWTAGVNGAEPGIVMAAAPVAGSPAYRQEYLACEAEDMGQVLATNESVTVPAGSYTGCVKTHDYTPLEPDLNEEKYYCPGVGIALTVDVAAGGVREELISVTP
jgi:hypothetical protein